MCEIGNYHANYWEACDWMSPGLPGPKYWELDLLGQHKVGTCSWVLMGLSDFQLIFLCY